MTAQQSTAVDSATPGTGVSRAVNVTRAAALLATGLAITFTAAQHSDLGFDLALVCAGLVLLAVAHAVQAVAARGRSGGSVSVLLAVVTGIAAVAVPFIGTALALAVVLAGWSLVSALLEFIGQKVFPGSRQDASFLGALGVLLAIALLLVRDDAIAVLGFFGAYAVIAAVFLGISAFDTRRATGGAERAVAR